MDPHLQGQQPDAFDGRERLFSGQRGRGGILRPSQAGVLPQAQLRGRLDGRVHQHAQRLHGLVPGQADQDGVRHEHHGSSTRARSCGMISGDGINDESNKTAPAPSVHLDLTEYTRLRHRRRSHRAAASTVSRRPARRSRSWAATRPCRPRDAPWPNGPRRSRPRRAAGRLASAHAARYRFDRLPPGFQGMMGFAIWPT